MNNTILTISHLILYLNNKDIGEVKSSLERLFEKKGGGDVKG